MHVVLLTAEFAAPAPALLEVLDAAGVRASVAAGTTPPESGTVTTGEPLFVLYEVADGADAAELHATARLAAELWPDGVLVACRRHAHGRTPEPARRLDAAALLRLGFRAVADEPAQVPALLRELEDSGTSMGLRLPQPVEVECAPASLLLPDNLNVPQLRAAFESVAALHFVSDQRSAAQTALAGVAALIRADRWALYLTEEARGPKTVNFEPLAARGQAAPARDLPEGDWRRALVGGDALLALAGHESQAARLAAATTEPVRKVEGARRVLAVPLVNGERVLGVVEAVREGAQLKSFSAREAAFLSAMAVPLTAALANSARIAEAERLSLTDDLTKLHNARFLRQYLTSEVKRARRYDSAVTALFLDLDDFKEINDQHGHLVGSHVLMEMATVILTGVRDTDVVARYGGDEFVVILPETNAEQAARVAERIRQKIAGYYFTGGRGLRLKLTASFGVAAFPQHAQSPQQLLADADTAMYEAKAARKNCVRLALSPTD